MSVNRENVTWLSPRDGKWRNGHFAYHDVNRDDPDWDYEWDVEYDYNRFWWVGPPRATWESAANAWTGANPGGTAVVEDPEEAATYDRMYDNLRRDHKR